MNRTLSICCMAVCAGIIAYSCSNKKAESTEKMTSDERSVPMPADQSVSPTAAQKEAYKNASDTTGLHSLSSSAAVEKGIDGMRFVRTADIKFKVTNVTEATYHIEDVANQYGGFVTYTNLHSTVASHETVPVSPDSSLDITNYTVENDITFRVPNKRLDSALRAMSGLVDFLDHRLIVATDVANQALSDEMREKRNREYEQRVLKQVDTKTMKQDEATYAQDRALQSREEADNAKLANLSLDNQVKYSTVHMLIYQAQSTRKVKVCNETNLERYKPSFAVQMRDALYEGWEGFEMFAVGIAHLWMFAILALVAVLGYRRWKRSKHQ